MKKYQPFVAHLSSPQLPPGGVASTICCQFPPSLLHRRHVEFSVFACLICLTPVTRSGEIVDCRTKRIVLHHLIMVLQNKKILISIVLQVHAFTCANIIYIYIHIYTCNSFDVL